MENQVKYNEPERQKLVGLGILAVGKACFAKLYSNSRLKKREPLIALGLKRKVSRSGETAERLTTRPSRLTTKH